MTEAERVARFLVLSAWTWGEGGGRCLAPGAVPAGVNPAVSLPSLAARLSRLPLPEDHPDVEQAADTERSRDSDDR